jgi:protein O-mannosyl-transferase
MKPERNKTIAEKKNTGAGNMRHVFSIAFLLISILIAYSNSLSGTWAMDDVVVGRAVGIRDINHFIGFRKMAYLTFLLNERIAPFTPANYRLFNILIHFLNAVLVYVLAYRTMHLFRENAGANTGKMRGARVEQGGPLNNEEMAFSTAMISSIIFALHPININAVAYIVQRMASLAAFFVLLSLLCYISAHQAGKKTQSVLLYIASGILVICGIVSKENAVVAVPLILLYDFVFLSGFRYKTVIKRTLIITGIGMMSIGLTAYYLKFYRVFSDIVTLLMHPDRPISWVGWMAVDVYWTPFQHILTEFRVVSRYILLIFVPLPQLMVFDWWGFPISTGITTPITTLLSMVLIAALMLFSVLKMKRFPLLCFGILWYLIAISLESFIAVGNDIYYEHRNYLPLTGLVIGAVGQAVALLRNKIRLKDVFAASAAFCMVLGLATFSRNFVWKDSITLWSDTLRKSPSNIRAMMSLANSYLKVTDFEDAEKYYKAALQASSRDKRLIFLDGSVYRLGMAYLMENDLPEAKQLLDTAEASIASYHLTILKGYYKALSGDIDGALNDYKEVLREARATDAVVIYTLMGDAYRNKGMWDEAIEKYDKAISIDHGFSSAYYGIGGSYMAKRNIGLAQEYFEKTLFLDPDNVMALTDMADLILVKREDPKTALTYVQKAVSKSPPFYYPYLTMGSVLIVMGREKESEELFRKALEHGMPDYMGPFSKARAYYMKGDREKAAAYLSELRAYKDLPEKMRNAVKP